MEIPATFPLNWPELGPGASVSGAGDAAASNVRSLVGEGKNEDISGALLYGKTAGEDKIVGSLQTRVHWTDTTIKRNTETEKLKDRAMRVLLLLLC